MSITAGTLIILAIFSYSLLGRKISVISARTIVFMALTSLGFTGTFLSTELITLSHSDAAHFLGFIILTGVIIKKRFISKKFLVIYSLFLFAVLTGVLMIIYPGATPVKLPGFGFSLDRLFTGKASPTEVQLSQDHGLRILRILIVFPFLAIIACKIPSRIETEKLISMAAIFFCIILSLELLLKTLGYFNIFDSIFFMFTGEPALSFQRAGLPVLQGLTSEPSHVAYALILPMITLAYTGRLPYVFYILIILMLVSGSLRTIAFSIAFIFLSLYYNFKLSENGLLTKKTIPAYLLFIIMGIFFLIFIIPSEYIEYSIQRFGSVFNPQESIGSTSIRLHTWGYAIEGLISRPLFGVGLGSISVFSGLLGSIVSIGAIGFSLYLILVKTVFSAKIVSVPFFVFMILMLFSWNVHVLYDVGIYTVFLLLGYGANSPSKAAHLGKDISKNFTRPLNSDYKN